MKKVFAIVLSALMICSLAGCGQSQTSTASQASVKDTQAATEKAKDEGTKDEVLSGGYTDAASPVVPDDVKAAFDKATEGLTGVGYVPVAYLGSQVVAGTNHLLLCKVTPVTEDGKTTYAIVTLYEDLNGGAEITDVQNCDVEAPAPTEEETPVAGGYTEPESPEVTADAKEALTKAVEGLDGASYEAKALLGTQVVAGTNYKLLCKITPIVPDGVPHYAIVTVYADLEGKAEITETVDFEKADGADAEAAEQAQSSEG